MRTRFVSLAAAITFIVGTPAALAQQNAPDKAPFTFCTIKYANNGWDEPLGFGWNTDWPDAGHALMKKVAELTNIEIDRDADGNPQQREIELTDPDLHKYPIIFASDVGTMGLTGEEAAALRSYLLSGGLLHVDDFWGERAWKNWRYEIRRVLPEEEYPLRDIPPDHAVFNEPFEVGDMPQIPGRQFWAANKGDITSERGKDHPARYCGIFDEEGRLLVFISHNTDVADAWEATLKPADAGPMKRYQDLFCEKAVHLGVNLIAYALSR